MIPPRIVFELASTGLVALGVYLAARQWRRVGWKCMAGWYLLRLVVTAVVVFVVGKSVHYDLEIWAMHGRWMLDGAVPGIDFHTPYSYGFNQLLKICARPNGTQFQLMVLFMLAEAAALGVLYGVLRRLRDECLAKRCVILYLTSPLYVTLSCTWAQDETLCLLFVALFIWCALCRREAVAVPGMALVAAAAIFFTKILVVYYLAPFLLLRRWKGAVAASALFAAYVLLVCGCGVNPFDFEFGRALGMGQGTGANVLDGFSSGNVWTVTGHPIPHLASGAVCFAGLALTGGLYVPAMLRRDADLAERFSIACEWSCVWIFVFNILYTMTFTPYILPVVPFLAFFVLDRAGGRSVSKAAAWIFGIWMAVKLCEVQVRWILDHVPGNVAGTGVWLVLSGVLVLLLSCVGLGLVLTVTRGRFAWLSHVIESHDA